jgi:hypothetical protein
MRAFTVGGKLTAIHGNAAGLDSGTKKVIGLRHGKAHIFCAL